MSTVRIEVLYPQMNDLYGDGGNLQYLKRKLDAMGVSTEIIRTGMEDVPAFAREKVDLLYIGPCTESNQEYQAQALQKYAGALAERMDGSQVTLMTGNAFELLGDSVINEDGRSFPCLGLIPSYARRFTRLRYNDLSLGTWENLEIVGFKNQLSHSYARDGEKIKSFLFMEKGSGWNPESKWEGFHKNWFFATYLLGPILPLNPLFSEKILSHLVPGVEIPAFPFEKEAYERRVAEFRQ